MEAQSTLSITICVSTPAVQVTLRAFLLTNGNGIST